MKSAHSRSEPVFAAVDLPARTGIGAVAQVPPAASPAVHKAVRDLLEALGPLIRTGRLKGPTEKAVEELERALAAVDVAAHRFPPRSPGAPGAAHPDSAPLGCPRPAADLEGAGLPAGFAAAVRPDRL